MRRIAGVDIGNSTTEVCIGSVEAEGSFRFLASAAQTTTGTKGTLPNVRGIVAALEQAVQKAGLSMDQLDEIRLNEAAPVIGDTAMETITETVITGSSMIGHDPSTPAGAGQAVGELISLTHLEKARQDRAYIVLADASHPYEEVANVLNRYLPRLRIVGVILQADEAVLVENRLSQQLPIVDEVRQIQKVPEGKLAAIEVALPGTSVRMLSNPYGIATLLELNAEETRLVTPIAKSLIGKRSGVVIRTPHGKIQEQTLPAGAIWIRGDQTVSVSIDVGAEEIMEALRRAGEIQDIWGQPDTNVGNMLSAVKQKMADASGEDKDHIRIMDLLAVDTLAPAVVGGSLAGEISMEKAVGIAAMVKTRQLPMRRIARRLSEELSLDVKVAGVEAVMAALGALTTPGTCLPLAILDMGGGSTDAALLDPDGTVRTAHQAGAGELVTMLIQTELGLKSRVSAEQIKRYPLAKVESLFHIRLENGATEFFPDSLEPKYYGRVVLLAPDEMLVIEENLSMEKIQNVRREAKQNVFVANALRALRKVAPDQNLRKIPNVVLVGGSAEDFEIPQMLTEVLADYGIVCGRGNIRGTEGPRNAVATGLLLSCLGSDGRNRG